MSGAPESSPPRAWDAVLKGALCLLSAGLGARGILKRAYIGQDFTYHRDLILSFPEGYTYSNTNPPGLYWLGSLIRGHATQDHYLPVLAGVFVALNAWGLWVLFGLLRGAVASRLLWAAACLFATLVPFRVIHAVALAADAFTLPLFAWIAVLTLRLYEDPRRGFSWVGLGTALLCALLCKYTFVGLLPAIALLLGVSIARRAGPGGRLRWALIGVLCLVPAAACFLLQAERSLALKGPITSSQWLPAGADPVMRWGDILLPKPGDAAVLAAPEYQRGGLCGTRVFSYPALLHVASFTDPMNLYEAPLHPRLEYWEARIQNQFLRTRTRASQALQALSVQWSLPFSALALVGSLSCAARSAGALCCRASSLAPAAVVLTVLALGYYAPIVLSLHRLSDPYGQGYWLPRLILPALVVFFSLGFVWVDQACARPALSRYATAIRKALAGYTLVGALIYAAFLL